MTHLAYSATALEKVANLTNIQKNDGKIIKASKFAGGLPLKVAVAASAAFEFVLRTVFLTAASPLYFLSNKTFMDMTATTTSAAKTILDATAAIATIHAVEKKAAPAAAMKVLDHINVAVAYTMEKGNAAWATVHKNPKTTLAVVAGAITVIALYYNYQTILSYFQPPVKPGVCPVEQGTIDFNKVDGIPLATSPLKPEGLSVEPKVTPPICPIETGSIDFNKVDVISDDSLATFPQNLYNNYAVPSIAYACSMFQKVSNYTGPIFREASHYVTAPFVLGSNLLSFQGKFVLDNVQHLTGYEIPPFFGATNLIAGTALLASPVFILYKVVKLVLAPQIPPAPAYPQLNIAKQQQSSGPVTSQALVQQSQNLKKAPPQAPVYPQLNNAKQQQSSDQVTPQALLQQSQNLRKVQQTSNSLAQKAATPPQKVTSTSPAKKAASPPQKVTSTSPPQKVTSTSPAQKTANPPQKVTSTSPAQKAASPPQKVTSTSPAQKTANPPQKVTSTSPAQKAASPPAKKVTNPLPAPVERKTHKNPLIGAIGRTAKSTTSGTVKLGKANLLPEDDEKWIVRKRPANNKAHWKTPNLIAFDFNVWEKRTHRAEITPSDVETVLAAYKRLNK